MAKSFSKKIPKPVTGAKDYIEIQIDKKESNISQPVSHTPNKPKGVPRAKKEKGYVIKTLKISPVLNDTLKDYMFTIRSSGKFNYTESRALEDAFNLLFAQTKIMKRPAEIKEAEERFKARFKSSKNK